MSKYTFDINKIKGRIKELRLSNNITQKKLAEALNRGTGTSRTTVTTWESNSNTILPDIQTIIDICNFFDCDLDYLFGKSNIKSQDHDTISNLLHISKESIDALRDNSDYGELVNKIINNKAFGEISKQILHLAINQVLYDVITTSFNKKFENKIESRFNEYYYSVLPFDMSQEKYIEYIKKSITFSEEFNPIEFIDDNFIEDGKALVYNKSDDFTALSKSEQYEIIISSIAEISYNYYISQKVVELSKQKLDLMLSEILQTAINKESDEIKSQIKENVL